MPTVKKKPAAFHIPHKVRPKMQQFAFEPKQVMPSSSWWTEHAQRGSDRTQFQASAHARDEQMRSFAAWRSPKALNRGITDGEAR